MVDTDTSRHAGTARMPEKMGSILETALQGSLSIRAHCSLHISLTHLVLSVTSFEMGKSEAQEG